MFSAVFGNQRRWTRPGQWLNAYPEQRIEDSDFYTLFTQGVRDRLEPSKSFRRFAPQCKHIRQLSDEARQLAPGQLTARVATVAPTTTS